MYLIFVFLFHFSLQQDLVNQVTVNLENFDDDFNFRLKDEQVELL